MKEGLDDNFCPEPNNAIFAIGFNVKKCEFIFGGKSA